MRRLLVPLFLLLSACAQKPLRPEARQGIDQVAAASLLGDQLVVDVSSRSLLHSSERTLDVAPWAVDSAFRELLRQGVEERGRKFVPFALDQKALEKAAGVRESRWKKIVGKQSQALLDLLFEAADRQGIKYFFLLTPPQEHLERFPLHRGNYGAYCDDRGSTEARAYVYFFFDFTLWEVASRKKAFTTTVDPSVTEAMTFGDCRVVSELKDPVKQLEDPMKKTMGLLMDALFEKMGWKVVPGVGG